ncbi:MAG: 4Fe-4S dicluster domain-containing protein [Candidatus Eisenbacteria bacterium]
MLEGFRGKITADAAKCIGCKLCMRDCPSDAIHINKVEEKRFEIEIDLDKKKFKTIYQNAGPTEDTPKEP